MPKHPHLGLKRLVEAIPKTLLQEYFKQRMKKGHRPKSFDYESIKKYVEKSCKEEQQIGLDTVLVRIKELENEKKALEQERSRVKVAERHLDPKEASSQAAAFFVNFRKRFDKAPIEEKKALLRQIVLGVSVNPEEKVARCSITKIPMVSPALRSALLPSGFVGRTCSGDSPPAADATGVYPPLSGGGYEPDELLRLRRTPPRDVILYPLATDIGFEPLLALHGFTSRWILLCMDNAPALTVFCCMRHSTVVLSYAPIQVWCMTSVMISLITNDQVYVEWHVLTVSKKTEGP